MCNTVCVTLPYIYVMDQLAKYNKITGMSAGINKAAIIGGADFDEETWLVEPPSLPARSDTEQNSGRIIEWLQVSLFFLISLHM